MRRREFITLLGGAAAAWPRAARAQQIGNSIRIGFFGASLKSPAMAAQYNSFVDELRGLGFVEGQNLIIEYRQIDDRAAPSRWRPNLCACRWT